MRKIKLAILCVPAEAAQRVADLLVVQRNRRHPELRPGPALGAAARESRSRRSERPARKPGLQGPEDPGRSLTLVRRLAFPAVAGTARMRYSHYPVVKRYHNRFWSCFSRFESWPGSLRARAGRDQPEAVSAIAEHRTRTIHRPDRSNRTRGDPMSSAIRPSPCRGGSSMPSPQTSPQSRSLPGLRNLAPERIEGRRILHPTRRWDLL